jgi:hypothetical protein
MEVQKEGESMKYLLPVLALSLMFFSSLPAHAADPIGVDAIGKVDADANVGQTEIQTNTNVDAAGLAQSNAPANPQTGIGVQGESNTELKTPHNNPALHTDGQVGAQAQMETGKKPNKNLTQLFQSFKKDGTPASADGSAKTDVNTSTQPK